MSQVQKISTIIRRKNSFLSSSLVSSSNSYQLKRHQGTSPAKESDQHQSEWDRARPLEAMPTFSKVSLFLDFLPKGKYHNRSFSQLLEIWRKEQGEIVLLPGLLGRKSAVITYNPQDYEKIFRTEGNWPTRRSFETLRHHRNVLKKDFFEGIEGLLHTQGQQWGNFRSVVNPVLMQPRIVQSYLQKMSNVNWEFIQRIKDIRDPSTMEVPDNFEEEINRYTLESVSVVALDKEIGLIRSNRDNPEAKKLFEDLLAFFHLVTELEVKPSFWKIFPTADYRKIMSSLDGINDFVVKHVQNAVDRLEKFPSEKIESEKGILEKLLKIDKKIATVMAMDMLIAGVDTTTSSLTGILLALAKNPEKQETLRKELRQILPQKDSPFTEESLRKMPYLRACIKEGLRIYPLGPGLFRETGKDLVLSGYRVPKGTNVSMITLLSKDDPKYFLEPEKYLPERWLRRNNTDTTDGIKGSSSSNPFVYLPFGFGPRMCVGRRIVELEMEITIARIIRNFNLEFNYPVENAFKNLMIFVPAIPLRFKFTDVTS